MADSSVLTVFLFYFQDLYKVTPAFEILTKSNTQVQPTQKPGVPVDSTYHMSFSFLACLIIFHEINTFEAVYRI